MSDALNTLNAAWERLRRTDRFRLSGARKRLLEYLRKGEAEAHAGEVRAFTAKLETALQRSLVDRANGLKLEFPEALPITPLMPEIISAIREHQVVIVCGATGSGKTTQLPKAALAAGLGRFGMIGCTQPRRIAATALASRLAAEIGCEAGREVGVKIRFDNRTGDDTVVKFMTDGILLAESSSSPLLNDYDCVILDEVHERSLNLDFLLGYFKLLLPKRPEFRLVISSATMESKRISEFFWNAPVFEVPGTLYPVEDCYLDDNDDSDLSCSVADAVKFAGELDPEGDILVFLPGEREIREAADFLTGRRLPGTEILPLYGRLGSAEQQKIFRPSRKRRVVLATNVAETSITIPGIRFVIDSGLVRISRYNPRLRLQELRIEPVSQAAARQRRGRCGRLGNGVCIHLYSEEQLKNAPEYTPPEIQRSSLAGVILRMAELKLPPIEEFPFLDPPGPGLIREGRTTLNDLQALTPEGDLTPLGRELARLPMDPHFGKMLIDARKEGVFPVMAVITAGLSLPDPGERPFEEAKAADSAHRKFDCDSSDFLGLVKLWRAVNAEEGRAAGESLRNFARKNFYNFKRLREWRSLVGDLLECFEEKTPVEKLSTENAFNDSDRIHRILLGAMPRQLAVYDPENRNYMDMTGKRFLIFPGSGLAKRKNLPQWLLFLALMETSRTFGRCVAEAQPHWLPQVAPWVCKSVYDQAHFDPEKGFVYARERVTAGSLIVHPGRRRHYGTIDPAAAREIFIVEGLVKGEARSRKCPWLEEFNYLLEELRRLEERMRRPSALLDETATAEHFRNLLPETLNSVEALEKDWVFRHRSYAPKLEAMLPESENLEEDERDFPAELRIGGQRIRLQYRFTPGEEGDGVTALVPEDRLNLLPANFPEYPVPGYLPWTVEHLLRSLPKDLRRELAPLGECNDAFCSAYREGKLFTDRPLADTLAEFLSKYRETEVLPGNFDRVELPEFLRFKVAVLDSRNRVRRILYEMPKNSGSASRLTPNLRGMERFRNEGWSDLPLSLELPETVKVPPGEREAYPALTFRESDNSFGTALFLDPAEAVRSGRKAVIALYRKRHAQQVQYFERRFRPGKDLALGLFLNYPDWSRDLADLAILDSLGEPPESLRTAERLNDAFELASGGEFGITFDRRSTELPKLCEQAEAIRTLLRKLPRSSWTAEDAGGQLDYLLREGFLRSPEGAEALARHLRGLRIRLERACGAPLAKDEAKGDALAPYVNRFLLAVENVELADHAGLTEFFLLLEEARIAAFAPEMGCRIRSAAAKLDDAWKRLRL